MKYQAEFEAFLKAEGEDYGEGQAYGKPVRVTAFNKLELGALKFGVHIYESKTGFSISVFLPGLRMQPTDEYKSLEGAKRAAWKFVESREND